MELKKVPESLGNDYPAGLKIFKKILQLNFFYMTVTLSELGCNQIIKVWSWLELWWNCEDCRVYNLEANDSLRCSVHWLIVSFRSGLVINGSGNNNKKQHLGLTSKSQFFYIRFYLFINLSILGYMSHTF